MYLASNFLGKGTFCHFLLYISWQIIIIYLHSFIKQSNSLEEIKLSFCANENILNKPVHCIKGVGQNREKILNKLGIYTIEDMISYFPRQYEDRTNIKKIIELQDGEACCFKGMVISPAVENKIRKSLSVIKVRVQDETGVIVATWFNQPYIKNIINIGQKYIFYGKIHRTFNMIEAHNPLFDKYSQDGVRNTCMIAPVYASASKISQQTIRNIISNALKMIGDKIQDPIPEWIRNKYNLVGYNHALKSIHFPENIKECELARKRLVFEELYILQMALINIKKCLKDNYTGIIFHSIEDDIKTFTQTLPFKLTNAQKRVVKEICQDMQSGQVMNRLVQGDVGSGKTAVAAISLYIACINGYQGAMMAPTEILAEQHFRFLQSVFKPFGLKTALLTGSINKKTRNQILENIKTGDINVVIGTHALIQDSVAFNKLGLVITDEQHRFGVRQRASLLSKGHNPHVLVMTATPIPRTLALILYGDLDISIIDELPPGRKPVNTYCVGEAMRERVYEFIAKKVKEGRQVYIVCPAIEETEDEQSLKDIKSAHNHAYELSTEIFKEFRVGLIHGRMNLKEREHVMKDFAEGEIDILVSTTVIEVGVDVPNACIMVVENAERFGLSQLHQLRGRVGRGNHESYCILFSESKSKICKQRLKIISSTNDGFEISEQDLKLRGPGEFFGTMQHGLPEFKIANLYKDMDILRMAQEAAELTFKNDPVLEKGEHMLIKNKIQYILETKLIKKECCIF